MVHPTLLKTGQSQDKAKEAQINQLYRHIGQLLWSMSRSIRQAMIDRDHCQLSLVRQCSLLDVSRAWVYYRPVPTRAEDLDLMALMDRQYLKTPFYGSRKMKAWLLQQGYLVSRKKVRRLMRLMGLEAIYRRPNTSKPVPGHRIYPYLLQGVEVNRVDQVWAADITYIPMAQGFLYLVAIMDWHSRQVLAWKLMEKGSGGCPQPQTWTTISHPD